MDTHPAGGAGAPIPHDSAHLHVSGEALYTDDIPEVRGTLHAAIGLSERAHARIKSLDLTKVRAAPGVVAVLTAKDVPGKNDYGPVIADDPIFATTLVQYVGQSIFAVAAHTVEEARRAARLAVVEYGLEADPDGGGRRARAIVRAADRANATRKSGGRDRLRAASAVGADPHRRPGAILSRRNDRVRGAEGRRHDIVYSSTQHPGEIQHQVAHALDVDANDVVVDCRRMGGGFGGRKASPAFSPASPRCSHRSSTGP
jgi:xanthine dehydrogenase large subunit